jgi:putative membrane protein insertion efficiency factor
MNPLSLILRASIRSYQLFLSPVLPGVCRHSPTCSEYAMDAARLHGPHRGAWLALKRIGRCQPWGTSGYDPVPEPKCDHHRGAVTGNSGARRSGA